MKKLDIIQQTRFRLLSFSLKLRTEKVSISTQWDNSLFVESLEANQESTQDEIIFLDKLIQLVKTVEENLRPDPGVLTKVKELILTIQRTYPQEKTLLKSLNDIESYLLSSFAQA